MGYEIVVTTLLKRNLPYQNAQEEIGRLINLSMLKDDHLKVFHKKNDYKFYSFNNLYPIEKSGVYQKGKLYIFRIRAVQETFVKKIKSCLFNLGNDTFQIISSEIHKFHPKFINMLYTATPVIVTIDGGPFMPDDNLSLLKERLETNAEKKYKKLFSVGPRSTDFIERIEMINRNPTVTRYKNMTYLGNKLKVFIRSDDVSQSLAKIVASAGLGEKSSSIGAGFCFVY
ncbi:CRISPR-associated endoribonuclease Cas6 [Sporolactobacillus sp. STCC-11]|uniref:CRISPR-associated endoribonuclease Cas6 n=1 Tax=Sporolactobacillus caesalpiniae TaxID=3230362 RepID=UPI00339B0255